MSSQAYVGTTKRTFRQAVRHLLESDYGLLGSRRVLELLAADIEELVESFYPVPDRLRSGWMIFTGTKANGQKPRPGHEAGDHELVTLAWPVLLPEDVQQLASWPKGINRKQARQDWLQQRLIRLVEYGWSHAQGPVLLTLADLATMVGLTTVEVSHLLADARQKTGKSLLTKGYYFDQGMRPTHKAVIIDLYEGGMDEARIACHTGHSQASVGKYIRDYERVKLMLTHHTPAERISPLLDMQPGVVRAYVDMVNHYHPARVPEKCMAPSQT